MKFEIHILLTGVYISERNATVFAVESNELVPFGKITDGNIELEVIGIDSFCANPLKQLILVRGKHTSEQFVGKTFYYEDGKT